MRQHGIANCRGTRECEAHSGPLISKAAGIILQFEIKEFIMKILVTGGAGFIGIIPALAMLFATGGAAAVAKSRRK